MFIPFGFMNTQAGGGGGDADATAYLSAVTTAGGSTDATIDAAVDTLFVDLKAAGVYTKLISFYPIIGGIQASHAINGNLNATYDLTYSGTWTHSADGQMIAGTSSGPYALTNYIVNTGTSAGQTKNFSMGTYVNTNTDNIASYEVDMGALSGNGVYRVSAGWTAGNYSSAYIGGQAAASQNPRGGAGMYVGTRNISAVKLIFNGSTINSRTQVSEDSSVYPITLGAQYNGTTGTFSSSKRAAFAFISEYLTDAEVSDLYDAVQTCQVSLGRQA